MYFSGDICDILFTYNVLLLYNFIYVLLVFVVGLAIVAVYSLFVAASPGDNDKPFRKNLSNISLLEVVSVVWHRGDIACSVCFSANNLFHFRWLILCVTSMECVHMCVLCGYFRTDHAGKTTNEKSCKWTSRHIDITNTPFTCRNLCSRGNICQYVAQCSNCAVHVVHLRNSFAKGQVWGFVCFAFLRHKGNTQFLNDFPKGLVFYYT